MESQLDKKILMENIDGEGRTASPENSRAATLAIALIEIREAIEAQTPIFRKSITGWDEGTTAAEDLSARLAALEQMTENLIGQLQETSKLLTEVGVRLETMETKCAGLHGG